MANLSTSKSYFGLFGLSENFDLDNHHLEKAYIEQQQKYHPDKQFALTACQKLPLLQQSMLINEAYRILKDPLQRAAYMLDCLGKEETIKDPTLLEEIFDLQEEASHLKSDEMDAFHKKMDDQIQILLGRLRDAFSHQNQIDAKNIYLKLRYLTELRKR